MGVRRRAREAALKALYSLEFDRAKAAESGDAPDRDAVLGGLSPLWEGVLELNEETRTFAIALVAGVLDHIDELNELITQTSKRWKLERMAVIDRNILRMASYEIAFREDIPVKVSINEAIEIAKRFGSAESAAFVNGILDRVAEIKGKLRTGQAP